MKSRLQQKIDNKTRPLGALQQLCEPGLYLAAVALLRQG
mgnify:FL=1